MMATRRSGRTTRCDGAPVSAVVAGAAATGVAGPGGDPPQLVMAPASIATHAAVAAAVAAEVATRDESARRWGGKVRTEIFRLPRRVPGRASLRCRGAYSAFVITSWETRIFGFPPILPIERVSFRVGQVQA